MIKNIILLSIILSAAVCVEVITLNNGAPVDNARNSLTAGQRGPILLQDYQLIERLQVHNRERIPERNVHARGATAKGYFVSNADVSNYTFANFLQSGKNTSIACRWSTVIHGRDSPEFLRDPRGFALKFYTEEGNYDIVGLNFPVFFIRDGIRFPEMIRSLKPNPINGLQEWWRVYDYFSNYPESVHMFSWLLDDVGIPASYRELDGWGVHTFKWINKQGKETFVRYYWKSQQGVNSLDDDEAVKQHFSFATTDLFDNIQEGNYPKWTLYAQLIPADNQDFIDSLEFDILDTTKEWPVDKIPLVELGELVFNQNVNSQFLENEQIAFSPSRYVPGIEASDEKMLQTRMFAYADTQTYRLGVNNQMLPINRPKCPFSDGHYDGMMNFYEGQQSHSGREINYFPSTVNKNKVVEHSPIKHEEEEVVSGKKVRKQINKTNDFYQANQRYLSWDVQRQDRFAKRVGLSLSDKRISPEVQSIWLGFWDQVNPTLALKITKYINQVQSLRYSNKASKSMVGRIMTQNTNDVNMLKLQNDINSFERASGTRVL